MFRSGFTSVFAIITALLAGCSSAPQATTDPLGAAPADFYIDVTVIEKTPRAGRDAPPPSVPAEPHLRPARFVLFSDGTLRYGADPGSVRGVNWLPPISRMLTRAQTANVWSLAQQLGLTDPDAADPLTNFKLIQSQPGERLYLADFRGESRRWNFIRRSAIDQPPDPALAKLVAALAELAWVEASDDANAMIAPRRYDFGPDPYARYRRTEPAK